MSDSKWKSNLLSSSFPLEYETARMLVSKGLSVSSEYTYNRRNDSGKDTDFSVDIHALGFTPFDDENEVTSSLHILVECKHRTKQAKWLFLPDPNEEDMSPVILGKTINFIDKFSLYSLNKQSSIIFDEDLYASYKCIEINGDQVYDKEIKHGISQLRYALPRLILDNILQNIYNHPDENLPFIYCPILLTTAELYISDADFSMQAVEEFSSVENIGTKVPYLLYYSDFGPDFENHCRKQFEELANIIEDDSFITLEKNIKDKNHDFYVSELPSRLCLGLVNGEKYYLNQYFTQFIVCNFREFPKLVDIIKETVTSGINKTNK